MAKPLDPFGDYEDRGYLQNRGGFKDPATIKDLEHQSYRLGIGRAIADLAEGPLDYQAVLDTHRTLFEKAYPTWAGKDRAATAPNLRIFRPGMTGDFAHPDDVHGIVEHALDPAEEHSPGKTYTILAHAHPFLDGNGRTITAVMDEAMRRQGKHVEWERMNKDAYLSALTRSLNQMDGRPMDMFLQPFVREGALSVEQSTQRLGGVKFEPARAASPEAMTMDTLIRSLIGKMENPERRAKADQLHAQMRERTVGALPGTRRSQGGRPDFDIGD